MNQHPILAQFQKEFSPELEEPLQIALIEQLRALPDSDERVFRTLIDIYRNEKLGDNCRKTAMNVLLSYAEALLPLVMELLQTQTDDWMSPELYLAGRIIDDLDFPLAPEKILPLLFLAFEGDYYRDIHWSIARAIVKYVPTHLSLIQELTEKATENTKWHIKSDLKAYASVDTSAWK